MNQIKYPEPKQKFKVLVTCFTYNHSKYIVDALDGFSIQKTTFPFACLVLDDCSTDGEQEVIKQWIEANCDTINSETVDMPETIVHILRHKTNKNLTFAFYLFKVNIYKDRQQKRPLYIDPWRKCCNYEAICEGDDYWISPLKLQKQYDCLEKNLFIDVCVHAQVYRDALTGKDVAVNEHGECERVIPVSDVILGEGEFVGTNTLFARIEAVNNIMPFRQIMNYDYSMQISYSLRGGMYYLPDIMSVYRYGVPGSFCNKNKDNASFKREYLKNKYLMLDQLDRDTAGVYHRFIEGRKLLYEIDTYNSTFCNCSIMRKRFCGFQILPIKEKIKVLLKTFFPYIIRIKHFLIKK